MSEKYLELTHYLLNDLNYFKRKTDKNHLSLVGEERETKII